MTNKSYKKKLYTRKHQKMNCNPGTKGKTIKKNSCFSQDVMQQLKESFNKGHPEKTIIHTEPRKIWTDLKRKLKTCNREDCWLDTIQDPLIRRKINKLSFAPKHPDKWKKKPNTWLSNFDIRDVLKQYEPLYKKFKLIGPTPIDFDSRPVDNDKECVWKELCTLDIKQMIDSGKTKLGIVFNLDKHTQGGSHWISMYVDLDDNFLFFMDSAGDSIPKQVNVLAKRIIKQGLELSPKKHIHYHENCPMEHQYSNSECGMYSLYFIITMLTNKTENETFTNYIDKIAHFKNKRIPDSFIHKYRKKYFNS
jgi:hypothetical protein